MFGPVGMGELLLVLLIFLLLFGSRELPQVARKLGKGYRDLQRMTLNAREEMRKIIDENDVDEKRKLKG
ncbi:MAG: twin-arginine translocase TatA/TatE family subunit [bacterium]|nr:twin-arginine translocase TatA/TatE family subunit [bacterium]